MNDDEDAREMLRLALLADDQVRRDFEISQARLRPPVAVSKPVAPKMTDSQVAFASFRERFNACLDAELDDGELGEALVEIIATLRSDFRDTIATVRKNDLDNLQNQISNLQNKVESHDQALVQAINDIAELRSQVDELFADQAVNNSASNISVMRR